MRRLDLARHQIVVALGNHTLAYQSYRRLFGSERARQTIVSAEIEVCIEGPPGAGNSYLVDAFSLANPHLRIAHHHHVGTQLVLAKKYQVPTITLLRNPVDSVLSKVMSWNDPRITGVMYRYWLSFWKAFDRIGAVFPVVPFETMTKNPRGVVGLINNLYGTSFSDDLPSESEVFARMDHARSARYGHETRPNPARPSPEKEDLRQRFRPAVASHPLTRLALHRYRELEFKSTD